MMIKTGVCRRGQPGSPFSGPAAHDHFMADLFRLGVGQFGGEAVAEHLDAAVVLEAPDDVG
ncbi:hypothetical protein [Halomonas sp. DP1Y21-3]|uniref:hypothetical protein n=1 Tax=Halomonas sp. DP1Y21-3 TaxID=2859080 RepID=UPI0021BD0CA1|nr:hypothetical protein [Halomonas sp. DP1Y21-3]